MSMIDHDLSQRIAKAMRAEPKNCWRNAFLALATYPELQGGLYVEGWAVTPNKLIIEHGWIELAGGRIIDPTAATLERLEGVVYFPGLKFTLAEARKAISEWVSFPGEIPAQHLPIVWQQYGWAGMDSLEYVRAFKLAWAYVQKGSADASQTRP